MLGCLEGEWVFVLDLLPLRSPAAPGGGLLSLSNDTFINLGLGVLNIVRFSLQRALQCGKHCKELTNNISSTIQVEKNLVSRLLLVGFQVGILNIFVYYTLHSSNESTKCSTHCKNFKFSRTKITFPPLY